MAGGARAPQKKRFSSRACGLLVGLLAGTYPSHGRAVEGHVENRCPGLTPAEYDELDARVLLLLRGEPRAEGPLPVVVCAPDGSYVEWRGERRSIVGRSSIVDEVVDIIERALHDEQRRADADPRTAEQAAVAAGQPMLERGAGSAPPPPAARRRADPIALSPKHARGGGASVGIEVELPSSAIGPAVGPAFDFGMGVGPLLVGGREAIRFTTGGSPRQLSFMDFQASVAYGAPFNPDRRWGIVARFGAEWMIAYPEGNSNQATVVPITDLGLRVAHGVGAVSLWLGLDVHFRLEPLRLRLREDDLTAEVSPSLTLGVAFVDWSRK